MSYDFSGDIVFKERLMRVIKKNELNGKSPYALYWAGTSQSGWSFGEVQYDLSGGLDTALELFAKVLLNAKDNVDKYLVDDDKPATGRGTVDNIEDKKVKDFYDRAQRKGGTSLSKSEIVLINQALASDYGRIEIDRSYDGYIDDVLMEEVNKSIVRVSGEDRKFLETDISKLFIIDFANQYGTKMKGRLRDFLAGKTVNPGKGIITKSSMLGVDDLLNFYFRTPHAFSLPHDPIRRFGNILVETGYMPADIDEALGVLQAYTFFVVPRRSQIINRNSQALDVFMMEAIVPARGLVIEKFVTNESTIVDKPNINGEVLVGDDNANTDGANQSHRLLGGGKNDLIMGQNGDDILYGDEGNDVLYGGQGNDTLKANSGNDFLFGGEDDDTYLISGNGNHHVIDNQGDNRLFVNDQLISDVFGIGENTWKSADGKITITHNSPYTITDGAGASVVLDEFEDGEFGIHLRDLPKDEPISNTVTGDPEADNLSGSEENDLIQAQDGNDHVYADEGADNVRGGGGQDFVYGGGGNDLIEGGLDADILAGETGDDRLYAEGKIDLAEAIAAGNDEGSGKKGDWLSGGVGDDILIGSADDEALAGGAGRDILVGGPGDDNIFGGANWTAQSFGWFYWEEQAGPDSAVGLRVFQPVAGETNPLDDGADIVYAGSGADWVWGSYGDDVIYAEDGDDKVIGEWGNDSLLGGSGDDALVGDSDDIPNSDHGDDYLDGGTGDDLLIGQGGADTLFGGEGDDWLFGDNKYVSPDYQGNDLLDGGSGNDILIGQGGDDSLFGGSGNDQIWGDDGDDGLYAGEGDDTVFAGEGDDSLFGDGGNDQLLGEAGDDYIDGDDGDDLLAGKEGDDTLFGEAGQDELRAGEGNDSLDGGEDDDLLFGEGGDDNLFGGNGNDQLQGGEGDDLLTGEEGDDVLFGQAGNDDLIGDSGTDKLQGGDGDDSLDGGEGNDRLFGDAGNDSLFGGDDNDQLQGGEGDDLLSGEGGDDLLFGQAGNDTLYGAVGGDQLQGGDGEDFLDGEDGNDLLVGQAGNDTLFGGEGDDELQGSDGDDFLEGGEGNDVLFGQEGQDNLIGGAGDDFLEGGAGDDTLDGGAGQDTLTGGPGDDAYFLHGGVDRIRDIDGQNQIFFDANVDPGLITLAQDQSRSSDLLLQYGPNDYAILTDGWIAGALPGIVDGSGDLVDWNELLDRAPALNIRGGEQADVIQGGGQADRLDGGAGNDFIDSGKGNDEISGGRDNDVLLGGAGNDLLYGNEGNDTLDGGSGNDQLSGGEGDDTYDFGRGAGADFISQIEQTSDFDTVRLGPEVTPQEVSLYRHDQDLAIVIDDSSNQLWISNYFAGSGYQIEQITFSDSTTWTLPDIDTKAISGLENSMTGTAEDDLFIVDNVHDSISEARDQGIDTVQSSVSYTLSANLENLTLTGPLNINATGNSLDNVLRGNSGNNVFKSGGGRDVAYGGPGDDVYYDVTAVEYADEGVDTLYSYYGTVLPENVENLVLGYGGTAYVYTIAGIGNGLDNVITGRNGVGGDLLDGKEGADTMIAGKLGSCTFGVDNPGDVVIPDAGGGRGDTVRSSISYQLGNYLENLTLIGSEPISGTGNEADNILDGASNSAANVLYGGKGDDTYYLGAGDSIVEAPDGGVDSVEIRTRVTGVYKLSDFTNVENLTLGEPTWSSDAMGDDVANELLGNIYSNRLWGGAGNDELFGNAGDDYLDGGEGADRLFGDAGNDSYVIDDAGDQIWERADYWDDTVYRWRFSGVDTVLSTLSYTLGDNLENLVLTGGDAINGTGNSLNNTLTGNQSANILDGGAGADSLIGGAGDDTYIIDNAGDKVTELADEGTDTVQSTVTYSLSDNVENLTLKGNAAIDGRGNNLNNILIGNAGSNVLDGGAGDDVYYVSAGDTVVEHDHQGLDTVVSSNSWTLGANLEKLVLDGSATANGTGNSADNELIGNSSDNSLDGKIGKDRMLGGSGNDTYLVDNPNDVVIENLSEGIDLVQSSVSYALTANLENLSLTGAAAINGTGNDLDNVLTGNGAGNVLRGKAGNDVLDGALGKDKLIGGTGNDTYIVENLGDKIIENVDEGDDTVRSSITFTLSNHLENLTLIGTDTVNGSGNTLDNVITGNRASNILAGGDGSDALFGGAGKDRLEGGRGNDLLRGGGGNDTLVEIDGNNALEGGIGKDVLTGGKGSELFIGGLGDDIISTGTGANLIAFNRGDGQDIVKPVSGASNTLSLGGGISFTDLGFRKPGRNLILDIGNGDQITLADWYRDTGNRSVVSLQMITDAMADFDSSATDPLLNNRVEQFDFIGLVERFDQESKANPRLTQWQLASALLDFHVAGSDDSALGGNLAYQYGHGGNADAIDLATAREVLHDAHFGTTQQPLKPAADRRNSHIGLR